MKRLIYFIIVISLWGTWSCSKNESVATYVPVAPDYSKEMEYRE